MKICIDAAGAKVEVEVEGSDLRDVMAQVQRTWEEVAHMAAESGVARGFGLVDSSRTGEVAATHAGDWQQRSPIRVPK